MMLPRIPLYHTITTHPHKRQSTYHQFCLDIKRQTLMVNGQPDDEHTLASESTLYAWMVNLFSDETVGLWFAYWCTQTALASVYQEMMMHLNGLDAKGSTTTTTPTEPIVMNPYMHLLDDGRQQIDIQTGGESMDDTLDDTESADTAFAETALDVSNDWTLTSLVRCEPMLHLTKPFRVFRPNGDGDGGDVVCRYMLHVWVYGCAARLGSYRVVWEER